MKLESWKLVRKLSIIYIGLVALLFIVSLLVLGLGDYGSKPYNYVGCYAYDALFIGFKCSGFTGAGILEFGLNYPLYHLYMPFFVVFRPLLIFAVLAMWFFPVLFVISSSKVVKAHV
jgi:hypothetical protein